MADCPQRRFRTAYSVRQCLRGRWVFIIGDSSLRVLFHHLLKVLGTPPSVHASDESYPSLGYFPGDLKEGKFCGISDNAIAHEHVLNCSQDYFHERTGTRLTFAMSTVSNQRTVAWDRYVARRSGGGEDSSTGGQSSSAEASTRPSEQVGEQAFVDRRAWPNLDDGGADRAARADERDAPDLLLFDTGLWNSRYGIRTLAPNDPRPVDKPDMFRRTLDDHVAAWVRELELTYKGIKIWAGAPACCNQFKHYAKRVSIDWTRTFNGVVKGNAVVQGHFIYWDRQSTSDVLALRDVAVGGEHGEAEPPAMVESLRADCTPGLYHPGGEVMQVHLDSLLGALCPGGGTPAG